MKKIVSVEINETEILIHVEDSFLFRKKEYVDKIDINKIKKIEKSFERILNGTLELTGISFFQSLEEACISANTNKEAIESINDYELINEITREITLLYEIPACRYKGNVQELFVYITQKLDVEKIEINEVLL